MLRWMPVSVLGVPHAERRGDLRPPVAALGAVARVAEPGHQLVPGVGDALRRPTRAASACR